ncbi:MAG: sulfatase [Mailhella sp.]|nr:sulfatase [Mailhella sp.]
MLDIKNAIVCMFDSWQYNYTGCYGNDWIKTPNFDRFAREGVLFENAYGNNMPTLPVRRSMMTGRFTLQDIGWGPLRPSDTTISDLCWGRGIDTILVYNNPMMFQGKSDFARGYARVMFSRGFDHFYFINDELYSHYNVDQFLSDEGFMDRVRALPHGKALEAMNREEYNLYLRDKQYWKCDDDHTVAVNIHEAIKMLLNRDKEHSMFMWIDNWDPHEPWDPPSVWTEGMKCPYDPDYEGADLWLPPMAPTEDLYTEPQLHHVRMLFAEKITLCDKYFGQLCDAIKKEGMWANTLLWLTSDHGEPLGNGEHGHGLMTKCRPWPYEELVHIPLIIKYPACPAGKRIQGFVQDCDCAPTVLDWLGVPIPANMQGKSLLPLIRGEVEKVYDFAIAGYYSLSESIITEEWSYIHWLDKMDRKDAGGEVAVKMYGSIADAWAECGEGMQEILEYHEFNAKNAEEDYKAAHSLDGSEQWTCTPGAIAEVPQGDELYYRKDDLFQLHNVIAEHPDIAAEMLSKLNAYMEDLRNS